MRHLTCDAASMRLLSFWNVEMGGASRQTTLVAFLLALVVLSHCERMPSKLREGNQGHLARKVASVAVNVLKSVVLYKALTLAWTFASWSLLALAQPSQGQLGQTYLLPVIHSLIGRPVSHGKDLARRCVLQRC